MTSYTHTASGPRFGHLRAHLRTYLVGVGATAALTAGALVAFLSLATFVAFNGLPFGGSSDDAGAAYLDPNTSAAPTAAAAALRGAPGAVAKKAAPGSHGASPAARSATAAAAGSGSGGGDSSGGVPSGKGPTEPGVSISPGDITPVPSLPSTSGPVTGAVQGVDDAAGTDLSGTSGGATRTVDGAANQAGTAAGVQGLGGQASGAVSGVTDRALGGGGPAGSLLGG